MPHVRPFPLRSLARVAAPAIFLLLLLCGTNATAQLVYDESFEGGLPDGIWEPKMSTVYDYTHQIETKIVHPAGGKRSWRVENRGGDPDIYGKNRAQLYTPEIIPADEGTEFWSGFAIYIGPWPNVDPKVGAIVYQHKIGIGGPELHLILKEGGMIYLTVNADRGSPPDVVKMGGTKFQLQSGTWHDFILRQVRALDDRGRVQLWHNGKEVFSYEGPAMMDGIARGKSGTVDVSYGVYWGNVARPGRTYVLYFDQLRVALGANKYDAVDPNRPSSTTPDAGMPPDLDAGVPPQADARTPPPPDTGMPPEPDAGMPPQADAGTPAADAADPSGVTVRVDGCAAAGTSANGAAGLAIVLALLLLGVCMRRGAPRHKSVC